MKIFFAESVFWDDRQELQSRYEEMVKASYQEAGQLLPDISERVSFIVQAVPWAGELIPETGEGAWTYNGELIGLFIDPTLPYGKEKLLENACGAVFHELNHSARFMLGLRDDTDFLSSCIFEGLATVFARERANFEAPWSKYEIGDAKKWLEEIENKGDAIDWSDYKFTHPDGRKWIGYKVGTYIVDQALTCSKKSIEELTKLESSEIKKLAEL